LACVCAFFCVCVVLCLGRGLATSWSPVQGVLPSVKWSRNWEISPVIQSGSKRRKKCFLATWQHRTIPSMTLSVAQSLYHRIAGRVRRCGTKRSWHNLKYYRETSMEGLRKTMYIVHRIVGFLTKILTRVRALGTLNMWQSNLFI
jgi:hypothetical protein